MGSDKFKSKLSYFWEITSLPSSLRCWRTWDPLTASLPSKQISPAVRSLLLWQLSGSLTSFCQEVSSEASVIPPAEYWLASGIPQLDPHITISDSVPPQLCSTSGFFVLRFFVISRQIKNKDVLWYFQPLPVTQICWTFINTNNLLKDSLFPEHPENYSL